MSDSIDGVESVEIQEGVAEAAAPTDPADALDPTPGARSVAAARSSFAMVTDPQPISTSNWRGGLLI
jgi:hypothetical protein